MRHRLAQQSISRRLLVFILLCALLSIAVSNAQQTPQSNPPKQETKPKLPRIAQHVVIISISGLRADYVTNPETYRLRIPNLLALRNSGAYAVGVESVYPSLSNPAHATMVTGVLPADHGITADFPFDETIGAAATKPHQLAQEIKTEPIWELARRDGLSTAALGWPLTAGAPINFNLPPAVDEQGNAADQATLRHYINPLNLLDQLSAVRRVFIPADKKTSPEVAQAQAQDEFRTEAVAALLEKERPHLLLVHLNSLKVAQQRYGVKSAQVAATLERLDAALAKITAAIERTKLTNDTTFFVLADSGTTDIEREYRPNVLLARKGFLIADAQGRITSWRAVAQTFGGSAAVFITNPKDEATIRAVEKLFNDLAGESDSPLWRVTSRRDAAKLGADPRVLLYLDAAPLHALSASLADSRFGSATARAAQGYLPSRAEMRAALIISGKGIKTGTKIEYARLLDIAPTVARLLGLEMKTTRGRVIAEAITQ